MSSLLQKKEHYYATYAAFLAKKISADMRDKTYVTGSLDATPIEGEPDISWKSHVYIREPKYQWHCGVLYDGAGQGVEIPDDLLNRLAAAESEAAAAQALAAAALVGLKVSGSVSPNIGYRDVATTITVNGSCSGVQPDTLSIIDQSDTTLKSVSNASSISCQLSATNNASFTIRATYAGNAFNATASYAARYPVYCGFGTTVTEVFNDTHKLSARTTAAGTYKANATADGQHYFILVPTGVTVPTQFSMGGAPYVMNSTTQTLGGIAYTILQSGASYNTGSPVNIVAS